MKGEGKKIHPSRTRTALLLKNTVRLVEDYWGETPGWGWFRLWSELGCDGARGQADLLRQEGILCEPKMLSFEFRVCFMDDLQQRGWDGEQTC